MTILSAMRLRARNLVNDVDEDLFDDTEIDDALSVGQAEAWRIAQRGASNIFNVTGSFPSTSAGIVDLTSVKPTRIDSITHVDNGGRFAVSPVRFDQARRNHEQVVTLSIVYVPDVTFPTDAANPFVWAHANVLPSAIALLDGLTVSIAALELKPKENEVLAGLQKRKEDKERALDEMLSVPTWRVFPLGEGCAPLAQFGYYPVNPSSLQLVTV